MTNLIQLNAEDLRAELKNVLKEAINEFKQLPRQPEQPDRMDLKIALVYMKNKGISMSASKAYKLSMEGKLPVLGKFGKKLIFSRQMLDFWIEEQTIPIDTDNDEVLETLKKKALKSLKK